ncbi:hypothetical protein HDU81_000247 [Chytriomyces hyalinus]|nr:hypothetical protein HDU81_000247 [Chytriomyces hyalinus]
MSSNACTASAPALQSALQSCGYVFDATGNFQPPVGMTQTALTTCVCSNANVLIFQSSLASCAADPTAVSGLNGLIQACAAAKSAGAGTGVGTGTGAGTHIITPCEIAVGGGIQTLKGCGVTIDTATGSIKQTASDAQTIACVCTAGNVLIYKQAQTVCESEISAIATQGIPVFKALVSGCAKGTGLAGAGAAAAGAGASASASAGAGSSSTAGSTGAVNTASTAAPAKTSGAESVIGLMGFIAAGALLI